MQTILNWLKKLCSLRQKSRTKVLFKIDGAYKEVTGPSNLINSLGYGGKITIDPNGSTTMENSLSPGESVILKDGKLNGVSYDKFEFED